jgi:hypothetical protein
METQQHMTAQEVYRAMTDKALGRKSSAVGIRHIIKLGRFSRVRSGRRTGTTPHFKMWMADLNIRKALEGTTLLSLADRETDPVLINSYLLLRAGGIKNVFQLTQAKQHNLLAIKGIGPKKLEHVKADLAKHQVAVSW